MKKLSDRQRAELERRLALGEPQYLLAEEYAIARTWVCRIAAKIGQSYNAKHAKKIQYARLINEIDAAIRSGERPISVARRLDVPVYYVRRYAVSIGQYYKQYHTKKARAYQSEVRA